MTAQKNLEILSGSLNLGRLLKHEENLSNLIAFMVDVDPSPFAMFLGLPSGVGLKVSREQKLPGKLGRLDLLAKQDGMPIAVLELKTMAGIHGDQLKNYETWADNQAGQGVDPPALYLVELNQFSYHDADRWIRSTISQLLDAWVSDSDSPVQWLAAQMNFVIDGWVAELSGPLGRATSPVVAAFAVKSCSESLFADMGPHGLRERGLVRDESFKDLPGKPSAFHFLPYPNASRQEWLSLDIRSGNRDDAGKYWNFRLGVEVDWNPTEAETGFRTVIAAADRALNLAEQLKEPLALSSFKAALEADENPELRALAATFSSTGRHDGFPNGKFATDLQGRRRSTIFKLDVNRVSAVQLTLLMEFALGYLLSSAQKLSSEASQLGHSKKSSSSSTTS